MTVRNPLVLVQGQVYELPVGDTISASAVAGSTTGDVYYNSVTLLGRCNALAAIVDQSLSAATITKVGSVTVSSITKLFAADSIDMTATGAYLTLPNSPNFFADGTGNGFTWECFYYPTSWTVSDNVLFDNRGATTTPGLVLAINSSHQLFFYDGTVKGAAGTVLSLNTWYHIAISALNGVATLWLNGQAQATAAIGNTGSPTGVFRIGMRNDGTLGARGYYDQIRVTSGINRYLFPFTSPTAPFAASAAVNISNLAGFTPGSVVFADSSGALTQLNSGLYFDPTTGRVGIGTNQPAQMFDIESTFGSYLNNMAAITQTFTRNTADGNGPSVIVRKSRGSNASPTVVNTNDVIGTFSWRGHTGSGTTYGNCAQVSCQCIDPTPSTTAMGGRLFFSVSPIGSVTQTEMLRLEPATGISIFGANVLVDANRIIRRRVFASLSALTTAVTSPVEGMMAAIQDASGTPTWGATAAGGGSGHFNVCYNGSTWIYG